MVHISMFSNLMHCSHVYLRTWVVILDRVLSILRESFKRIITVTGESLQFVWLGQEKYDYVKQRA